MNFMNFKTVLGGMAAAARALTKPFTRRPLTNAALAVSSALVATPAGAEGLELVCFNANPHGVYYALGRWEAFVGMPRMADFHRAFTASVTLVRDKGNTHERISGRYHFDGAMVPSLNALGISTPRNGYAMMNGCSTINGVCRGAYREDDLQVIHDMAIQAYKNMTDRDGATVVCAGEASQRVMEIVRSRPVRRLGW